MQQSTKPKVKLASTGMTAAETPMGIVRLMLKAVQISCSKWAEPAQNGVVISLDDAPLKWGMKSKGLKLASTGMMADQELPAPIS